MYPGSCSMSNSLNFAISHGNIIDTKNQHSPSRFEQFSVDAE